MNDSIPEASGEELERAKLDRFGVSNLLHTFNLFKATSETKEAKEVLSQMVEGSLKLKFVLLWGGPGSGKTHLIEATVIEWASHGLFTRYLTFSDIARKLKGSLREPGQYDIWFKAYCEQERLVIDDFGSGTTESRFEVSDLEDIIDLRYRKRFYPNSKLITIMASNKDIKELPDRVVSRFYDPEFGKVIYMGDKDYRRRKVTK